MHTVQQTASPVILNSSLHLVSTHYGLRLHTVYRTKNEKVSTKTTAKLIHNNMYCFFITIFRLAIPAFFRFADVISYKKQYTLL